MIATNDGFINRCECVDGLDYDKVIFRRDLSNLLLALLLKGINRTTIESIYYRNLVYRVDYTANNEVHSMYISKSDPFWDDIYNCIDDFVRVTTRENRINKILG